MQLLLIFIGELHSLPAKMLKQLADEGARANGGIENFHALVDEALAEMFLAKPIGAFDHKTHNLIGRVDHTEPVGGLLIVDLIKVLIDDLEKGLLFRVTRNLRRGGADRSVIRLKLL